MRRIRSRSRGDQGGAMRNARNRLRVGSLLCVALGVAGVAWAQSSYTAAVRGVVTDASGGAIPGAIVTVMESDRNVPHTVTTDSAGRYVVTALPPGQYTLSVELSGFKIGRASCRERGEWTVVGV